MARLGSRGALVRRAAGFLDLPGRQGDFAQIGQSKGIQFVGRVGGAAKAFRAVGGLAHLPAEEQAFAEAKAGNASVGVLRMFARAIFENSRRASSYFRIGPATSPGKTRADSRLVHGPDWRRRTAETVSAAWAHWPAA